jgi:transposase-like protein
MIAQKNGVSATGLAKILGLKNYHIAWTWLHKFRRLMVVPGREKLTGRVEVDECFIGGVQSGKRGRGALGKVLVIIAVEENGRGTGRVRMAIIPSATYTNIRKFITENITTSSVIVSDGHPSYKKITDHDYLHEIEIQTKELDDNNQHVLPRVHIVISLLKRWLLGTHQGFAKKQQLEYYLDEFVFRYNRRNAKSRGLLFHRLLEQSVKHHPVTYRDIVVNKPKI